MIEQPDMGQDGAETVVSMRQIVLQREGALILRSFTFFRSTTFTIGVVSDSRSV
jgi:hypothetical protein